MSVVVTLLTVQNTQGVTRVDVLSAELVEQQLDAVLNDILPAAIKTEHLATLRSLNAWDVDSGTGSVSIPNVRLWLTRCWSVSMVTVW